jgi:hypothetical protein
MKPKVIKPGEEFQIHDGVYSYAVENGVAKLKRLRNADIKPEKKAFVTPTLDEVKAFFKEKGYREDLAITFFEGYENGNPPWHDSKGNPVRAWKQKAIQVWFKPDAKIKPNENAPKGNFFKE